MKQLRRLSATKARMEIFFVFTDGSVKRGEKSGWAFTVRCRGETVGEGSGAVEVTTSSMVMEIKAVTKALKYLQLNNYTRAVIITDSMSTLQKVEKESSGYMQTGSTLFVTVRFRTSHGSSA